MDNPSILPPPHSLEAEQNVLGCLMADATAWDKAAGLVRCADFFHSAHRVIFAAIEELAGEGRRHDAVLVADYLWNKRQLDEAGGMVYLGQLVGNFVGSANIDAYAGIVHDRAKLRELIRLTHEIGDVAYQPGGLSCREIFAQAEQRLAKIAEGMQQGQRGPVHGKTLLTKVLDNIDRRFTGAERQGLTTGFDGLDTITSGLQQGDLIVLAGRPSMGKTTFAMNVAEHVCGMLQEPVLVFSMEMPGVNIMQRTVAAVGGLPLQKVRNGQLEDEHWPRLTSSTSAIAEWAIHIDDTPALTPADLRTRARRLAGQLGRKLGLVVVDYLQLMRVPGLENNRVAEVSEVSRSLKALAKELECPVIALSQLNRSLEQRRDKRPVMSDLRDSGAIEQDADHIWFIYRDVVYNPDTPMRDLAELIVGKNRNGEANVTVPLRDQLFLSRFVPVAPNEVPAAWNEPAPPPEGNTRKARRTRADYATQAGGE
jgi:replicative DNA helicase